MNSIVDYVSCYATDVTVLKGEGGSLVIRCELPDSNKKCPDVLWNQKAVVLKWSSSPDEYTIHNRIQESSKRSILACFGGATGRFTFDKLIPNQFQTSVRNNISKSLLKNGTLNCQKDQSIIVMPEMDFSLDNVLCFFTKEQRQRYIPILKTIYEEAAKSLAKIGLIHGDVRVRNIFIKLIDRKYIRTVIADFNKTKKMNNDSICENTFQIIKQSIINAPFARLRDMKKSPFSDELVFLGELTPTPPTSPLKMKNAVAKLSSDQDTSQMVITKRKRVCEENILAQYSPERQEAAKKVKRSLLNDDPA